MSAIQFDVAGLKDSAGTRVYLGIGTSVYYTEQTHSWYTEDVLDATVQADVRASWAAANGEDVNSGGLTDLPAPIGVPDLTQTVGSEPWVSGLLTVAQAAVNVHKPAGVARPSLWTATGGATITTQTDTQLDVLIAPAVAGQGITRTLTTRYWTQMDRLQPPNSDSAFAYKADWPIFLKANLSTAIGGSIPGGDPLLAELTADEDVTNYDSFSYLKFKYTAPAGVTPAFTVILTYNELAYVSDPCYTGWQYRFGPDGEWAYAKGPNRTATYTHDYLGATLTGTGAQTYYLDLKCPDEGDLLRGALQHVAAITITGFTEHAADPKTYTLDMSEFKLCDGPVGSQHIYCKAWRPWNWATDFVAYSGLHDGAPNLAIQYGYEQFERVERGLKGTQYAQHNPGSAATSDLSSAKTLSRFADELGWQEGFTATWEGATFLSRFRDANNDDFLTASQAHWWWLRYEPDQALPLKASATVRTWTITPGAVYTIYVRHFLRGEAHGILKDAAGTHRTRSGGSVAVYSRADSGGATTLVGTVATDAHGRWRSAPLAEKGYSYFITVAGADTELGRAVNREWMSADAYGYLEDPWLVEGPVSNLFLFYAAGERIWVTHRPSLYQAWQPRRFVATGSQPVAALEDSGALKCCYLYDGAIYTVTSPDGGRTWA